MHAMQKLTLIESQSKRETENE